jgi:hypothetical protein
MAQASILGRSRCLGTPTSVEWSIFGLAPCDVSIWRVARTSRRSPRIRACPYADVGKRGSVRYQETRPPLSMAGPKLSAAGSGPNMTRFTRRNSLSQVSSKRAASS